MLVCFTPENFFALLSFQFAKVHIIFHNGAFVSIYLTLITDNPA